MLRTHLIVALNRWTRSLFTSPIDWFSTSPAPPDEFRMTLNDFCGLSEREGFGLVFVVEPTWESLLSDPSAHEEWHRAIHEVGRARGVAVADPIPLFAQHLGDDLWATWVHQNEAGNVIMADAVAPVLSAEIAARGQ
jgi:hypothetical protein